MGKWWLCGVATAMVAAGLSITVGLAMGAPEPAQKNAAVTPKTAVATAQMYGTLSVWNGRLALFCKNDTPDEVYEVWVSALPKEEQERLAVGIPIADRAAFLAVLQEYTG